MKPETWIIFYVTKDRLPYLYQTLAVTMEEAIRKFELEEYSKGVESFRVGMVSTHFGSGINDRGIFRFTEPRRSWAQYNAS